MNPSRSALFIIVLVASVLLVVGLVWADYHFAGLHIGGEGFFLQWTAIQSLAKSGNDPYSDTVTNQIRAVVPRENAFVKDIYPRYTSPLYSGVVVYPYTLAGDKTLGHALWLTSQLILVFSLLLLCVRLAGWNPTWYSFLLFSLFTVFAYHVVVPWLDGGLSIWAVFFLVLALVSIHAKRDEMAGILLALATIQPQAIILPLIFIIIWSISKKRAVVVLWFFIALILLVVITLFLLPGWVLQYVRLLYHFAQDFPPGTPGLFFSSTSPGLGKQLGWLITGISAAFLIIEWLLALKKDFRWFLWTTSLTMVISQWIGVPTIPANFILLILPLVLVAGLLSERWPHGGSWGAVFISLLLLVWEWGIFYLDLSGPEPAMQLNLIFPLPGILLIGLYWVRHWAVKPRRLLIEELRLSETY